MSQRSHLQIQWLGRLPYATAYALQRALWADPSADHLLLLEHTPVYTLGVRAKLEHLLVEPASVGAELLKADRGGDITYHGPGQLVGYLIASTPRGSRSTPRFVHSVEQLVIEALADVGLPGAARKQEYPGVWIDDRKICAIGLRISRGRSLHGFALNVDTDMTMFEHIVPCGIREYGVTSLAREGIRARLTDVRDAVADRATIWWAHGAI